VYERNNTTGILDARGIDREDRELAGLMGGIHFTFHVFPDASGVGEATSDD
jgi:hypothetical protein